MQLADYQYTSYLSLVVLHESKTIASFSWQGNEMTPFFHQEPAGVNADLFCRIRKTRWTATIYHECKLYSTRERRFLPLLF